MVLLIDTTNKSEYSHDTSSDSIHDSLHDPCSMYSQIVDPSLMATMDNKKLATSVTLSRKNRNLSVTFAEPIVSEVRTRPRTKHKNKSKLFYTAEEYMTFRREYRAFREGRIYQPAKSQSTMHLVVSFASNILHGLDVRQTDSSAAMKGLADFATRLMSSFEPSEEKFSASDSAFFDVYTLDHNVSISDLHDVLYLY